MTANKPNAATRAWAGKQDPRPSTDWVPHKGPYKVIKLPRGAGITPPSVDDQEIELP